MQTQIWSLFYYVYAEVTIFTYCIYPIEFPELNALGMGAMHFTKGSF